MFPVVGRVQALPVPARREVDVGPDAAEAGSRGEALKVQPCIRARREVVALEVGTAEAPEAALRLEPALAAHRVPEEHAEAVLEGRRLARARRRVVDGDAADGAAQKTVGDLRDALVGAIACAEVQVGGPVVRQVLREGAGRAGCEC